MIQNSEYEESIRLLCKCNNFIDDPEEYLNDTYFKNSEISAYFWDKGFDSAMRLADYLEQKLKSKDSHIAELEVEVDKLKRFIKEGFSYIDDSYQECAAFLDKPEIQKLLNENTEKDNG